MYHINTYRTQFLHDSESFVNEILPRILESSLVLLCQSKTLSQLYRPTPASQSALPIICRTTDI